MNIKQKKLSKSLFLIKGLFIAILLYTLSAPVAASNYPLEIIQPQPNLDTKNRFYKAYPGLEYNVRLAVIGGLYPYQFRLVSGPLGMSIDKRGEITWTNPVATSTPYNISAVVTDAESKNAKVSWTITVTTNGFRFIDSINGTPAVNGGTGSYNAPWKSLKDMYEGDMIASKTANSYANEFIYWRDGTYIMDAYKEDSGRRIPLVGNFKPQVWLTYPGENPVIDMANSYLSIYGGGSNLYIDGLEFNVNGNSAARGITIDSSASNVTFRRNKIYGITGAVTGGNNACIFIFKGNISGNNYVIQDNEMYDIGVNGYGILGYRARYVLVENNVLHNINRHPISPKQGTQKWFIRSNRMYDNAENSINLQYSDTSGILSGDIEISHNIINSNGGKVRINSNQTATGLPVYVFRNTFMDVVQQDLTTASNGPFYWSNNVIVNETVYPDKVERFRIDVPSRVVVVDNLVGKATDNIVDSQGNLTAGYSSYVGTHGHQIVIKRSPAPPNGVSAQ